MVIRSYSSHSLLINSEPKLDIVEDVMNRV